MILTARPNSGKFLAIGFLASSLLLALYFLILTLAESFNHALLQFGELWYWMLLLVLGFGFQTGLYFYVKESLCQKRAGSAKIMAASGGISTGSMIACCLHHLADVLPLLGLSAAAVFLAEYQVFFIFIGIVSNLIGSAIMLETAQKNALIGFLPERRFNMKTIRKLVVGLSPVVLLASFFLVKIPKENNLSANMGTAQGRDSQETVSDNGLPGVVDDRSGVSFEVTPLILDFSGPLEFKIKIDTHSGSLDFDLKESSVLEDGLGNTYLPFNWDGPAPGGHHIDGTLSSPGLKTLPEKLKLSIKDSPVFPPRVFEWDLK